MSTRLLAVVAGIELGTLLVLLVNLATVHVSVVPTLLGPLHGCAYLAAIVGTAVRAGVLSRAGLLSVIPGVGATLAVAVLRRRAREGAAQS